MITKTTKTDSLFVRRSAVVANGVGIFNEATVSKAEGAIITDVEGRELIDFAGGIGVVNAGHCPPPVVAAVKAQADKYLHTSFNVVTYEPYIQLCEDLCEILPHGEFTKAMLVSTGAEAVENAIKIARQYTKRPAILCFSEAYHGRTLLTMSLTGKTSYKIHSGPFAPEIYKIPFPNYFRYGNGRSLDQFVDDELEQLDQSTITLINADSVAAVIVETIQGEGGFNPMPHKYMEGLRRFCDRNGILLILDEIQSGFCRTGKWAAWQHYDVLPDISTYAKSLGSGLPIAAVLGRADVMDSASIGSIGGTYIGSPVCCAAAIATIQYMKDLNLNQRGKEIGEIIMKRMLALKEECPGIGDVRGIGAMIGIEFLLDGNPLHPNSSVCGEVQKGCLEDGLIIISAGSFKSVVRILTPLVITDEQLEKGLSILSNQIKKQLQNQ